MSLLPTPGRAIAGAFVLHTGWEKWSGSAEVAAGVHGMASTAYPFLQRLDPERFLKLVAAGELAVGAALLAPFVPRRVAGAALTAFAGSLLGLYATVPGLRREGSIWPTPQGLPLAKDSWLLGIGLDLLVSGTRARRCGAPARPSA